MPSARELGKLDKLVPRTEAELEAGRSQAQAVQLLDVHGPGQRVQQVGVLLANPVEAQPAVHLLRPVAGVRDEEDELVAHGAGLLERLHDDCARVTRAAVVRQRPDVLDLSRASVREEVGRADRLALDSHREVARVPGCGEAAVRLAELGHDLLRHVAQPLAEDRLADRAQLLRSTSTTALVSTGRCGSRRGTMKRKTSGFQPRP